MMVKSDDLYNRPDWPSLQMGSSSYAEILETPLTVDFSYQQSPADSFSAEDIWEVARLIMRRFPNGWLANK